MEPNLSGWSIVLVGAWNPAILMPPWLGKHVLEQEDTTVQILLPLAQADQRIFDYSDYQFRLIVRQDRVQVAPMVLSDKALTTCETVVGKLLSLLPHTPITAIGINLAFQAEGAQGQLIEVLTPSDGDVLQGLALEPQATSIKRTLRGVTSEGSPELRLTMNLDHGSGTAAMEFNYHFDYTPMTDVLPGAFERLRAYSARVVEAYGETVAQSAGEGD